MSAAYFRAAIPEPYRILGLQLKPLSLGRYRLMRRFGVSFVDDNDAKAGFSDLILGVLICSMRCDEFLTFANSRDFGKEIRRWGRKAYPRAWVGFILGGTRLGRWWRRRTGFNLLHKLGLFQRYLKEHTASPKYWDETENEKPSGAHWSQSMEVVLRSQVGWSDEEINESPLSKAISDYFKYAENNGSVRLMTQEEIDMIEAMEKEAKKNGP